LVLLVCFQKKARRGDVVSATVLYMSMSLDGFIAGPNEGPGNGLGDGGHRLHEWVMGNGDVDLEAIRRSGTVNGQVVDEFMATGAVVAGRGTFEPAGGWGGDHHDGVPIFVRLALAAGVLDELELHVIPVLFGQGRRLFEGLAPEQIELERTRVLEGESGVTHMHYRVQR
jgi:dihydrofolate reductase